MPKAKKTILGLKNKARLVRMPFSRVGARVAKGDGL